MKQRLNTWLIEALLIGAVLVVIVFFYIPIVTLIAFSFKEGRYLTLPFDQGWTLRWYAELFTSEDIREATFNSFFIASISTLIATSVGLGAAQCITRFKIWGRTLFQALVLAPLVFPQLLLGVVLLLWFSVLGNVFEFSTSVVTAIIGHCVFLVPFTTIIIGVQAASFDPIYEQAAQDCGASTWQVYREVTIPILWPGIFSAVIFAFLLSWGNFYLTYSLSGTASSLPTFVFAGMGQGASPLFPAIATVTFAVGLTLIIVADWLRRRAVARTSAGGHG